jgi:anti-sigma regulatory factor (Ser/Thr protein kinase)
VAAFRDFVEDACRRAGADDSLCFDLKLAVDEACSNLVVHGYDGRDPGMIKVGFALDGDDIVITISDHAAPFHPEHAPAPLLDVPASERRPGGLGWHLIKQIADRLEYESDPETGNHLTMVKKLVRREPE